MSWDNKNSGFEKLFIREGKEKMERRGWEVEGVELKGWDF